MKEQPKKVFVGLEVIAFIVAFCALYSVLGAERIFLFTGVDIICNLIPFGIVMLLFLMINGMWFFKMAKSSFIKNPYIKTAISCVIVMISLIIVHCYLYIYAYSGMR